MDIYVLRFVTSATCIEFHPVIGAKSAEEAIKLGIEALKKRDYFYHDLREEDVSAFILDDWVQRAGIYL